MAEYVYETPALRPRELKDFVGQEEVCKQLKIVIEAARLRDEPPEHILLSGPPGLGKTTLSEIIAGELGSWFHATAGSALTNASDLFSFLGAVTPGAVIYVDEIHRVPKRLHEVFYPVMEDFRLELPGENEDGDHRKGLPKFTLVGATTRPAMLSAPFLSRFGVQLRLDYYEESELATILERSALLLGVQADAKSIMQVAKRSRGTPRTANQLLKRVRDYAMLDGGAITPKVVDEALTLFEIDAMGLTRLDRQILRAIIELFGGGPVGLETLATAVGEEADTLLDLVEPFLLRRGFIIRAKNGRGATDLAYKHLGKEVPGYAFKAGRPDGKLRIDG